MEQKASWANVIARLTRLKEKFAREIEQPNGRWEQLQAKYLKLEKPTSASFSRSSPEINAW